MSMPEHIRSFVSDLHTDGFNVWLIGSQLNPTGKIPTDWDFIIIGNEALIQRLSEQPPVRDVDALIVFNGNDFRSPWPRASDGVIKCGSLSEWKWKQVSENQATYEGTKWPNDWGSLKQASLIKAPMKGTNPCHEP